MKNYLFCSLVFISNVLHAQLPSMIPYFKDGKFGYMSPQGKMLISPSFKKAELPTDGWAIVSTEDGDNLVNAAGKFLMPVDKNQQFAYLANGMFAWTVYEDFAFLTGMIDKTGSVLIKPKYEAIMYSGGNVVCAKEVCEEKKCNPWVLLNLKGDKISTTGFAEIITSSSDIAIVKVSDSVWGVMNSTGDLIIPAEYSEIKQRGNILACENHEGKNALFSLSGKQLTEFKYGFTRETGLAQLIVVRIGDSTALVNEFGKEITPFSYQMPFQFSEGGIWMQIKNGGFAWLDKSGKVIITTSKNVYGDFSDGLAPYFEGNLFGFIDKKGSEIIKAQYTSVTNFVNGSAAAEKDGKWFLIDKKGKPIKTLQHKVDRAEFIAGGLLVMWSGKFFYYMDYTGRVYAEF